MTTSRRRFRTVAEQAYWDKLSPRERVVFAVGYACGADHPFPSPSMIEALEVSLGARKPPRRPRVPRPPATPQERPCVSCGDMWTPEPKRGRPYTRCVPCREAAA